MTRRGHSGPVRVAVGLGSNLGDRGAHLARGVSALEGRIDGLRCSPVYESDPAGEAYRGQPRFLNACCVGRTRATARRLLETFRRIEAAEGRRRPAEGAERPRTLDVDLLLYGDRVIDEPGLQVPHPRMTERAFVLLPLADVAPGWRHPVAGLTVRELAARADGSGVGRYGGPLSDAIVRRP